MSFFADMCNYKINVHLLDWQVHYPSHPEMLNNITDIINFINPCTCVHKTQD